MEQLIGNDSYINSHLIPVGNLMVQHFQVAVIVCYAINKDLFKFDCLKYPKVPKTELRVMRTFSLKSTMFLLGFHSHKDIFI